MYGPGQSGSKLIKKFYNDYFITAHVHQFMMKHLIVAEHRKI